LNPDWLKIYKNVWFARLHLLRAALIIKFVSNMATFKNIQHGPD